MALMAARQQLQTVEVHEVCVNAIVLAEFR